MHDPGIGEDGLVDMAALLVLAIAVACEVDSDDSGGRVLTARDIRNKRFARR